MTGLRDSECDRSMDGGGLLILPVTIVGEYQEGMMHVYHALLRILMDDLNSVFFPDTTQEVALIHTILHKTLQSDWLVRGVLNHVYHL